MAYIHSSNRLVIKSWNKDLADLFDYEEIEGSKYETTTKSNGYIVRTGNKINLTHNIPSLQLDSTVMAYLDCDSNDFFYCSKFEGKSVNEQSWLNLKALRTSDNASGYLLSQGDVIKVGRIRLKVRDINVNGTRVSQLAGIGINLAKKMTADDNNEDHNREHMQRRVCRICYGDEKDGSPLISPCKCSGGLKYIHFSCLQQWLKTKSMFNSSVSNAYCIIYQTNQVKCEICKEELPDFLRDNGVLYEIFDFIECKFKSYLSLESIPKDARDNKKIYLVGFDNKTVISIGRSHEVDVRVTDITVSRFHARIIVNADKSLLYQDCGSKFGSLVLLQNNRMKILPFTPLSVQISQSLFVLSIKRNMLCCDLFSFSKRNKSRQDYGVLNKSQIKIEKILVIKDCNDEDAEDKEDGEMSKENNMSSENNKLGGGDKENKGLDLTLVPSSQFLLLKSNLMITGVRTKVSMDEQMNNKQDDDDLEPFQRAKETKEDVKKFVPLAMKNNRKSSFSLSSNRKMVENIIGKRMVVRTMIQRERKREMEEDSEKQLALKKERKDDCNDDRAIQHLMKKKTDKT